MVVLTRHAGYKWGPAIYKDPTPKVDKIVWKIVPEESTRLTALQSGQADLSRYLPQWAIKDLKADKRLFVSKADPFYWTFFLGFKIDKPMLTDVNVRRALNLAINRKALTEAITFGEAVPATSMLATNTPAGSNDAYRYDPAAANKLLDEAGWKMGKDGYQKLKDVLSGLFRSKKGKTTSWTSPNGEERRAPPLAVTITRGRRFAVTVSMARVIFSPTTAPMLAPRKRKSMTAST